MELNAISIPPTTGGSKAEQQQSTRISCCYGAMVFLGLTFSLLALTMLVIYAGVWSQMSLYDDHLIVVAGGDISGEPSDKVEVLTLPASSRSPRCASLPNLPYSMTGAVGSVLEKQLTICGGRYDTETKFSAVCYKLTSGGWKMFASMSKTRAFSAAVWVPRRGWWITGGINEQEADGISTTDIYSIASDPYYDGGTEKNTFISGPVLKEPVSHHCIVRIDTTRMVLIGGRGPGESFSSKVWLYDWAHREWESIAPLYDGRNSHSCALVNDGAFVVVAGGLTADDSGSGTVNAEMLEVETGIWHKLPDLPRPLYGAHSARLEPGSAHGTGLLAFIGGSDSVTSMITFVRRGIFEDNHQSQNQKSLQEARLYPVVIVANPRLVCV